MARVTVQMGHVGTLNNPGERALVQALAPRIEDGLTRRGHEVIVVDFLGGPDDPSVPVPEGDVFIALHADAAGSGERRGASVGYERCPLYRHLKDPNGAEIARAWKEAYEHNGWPGGFHDDNYTVDMACYYMWRRTRGYRWRYLAEHGFLTNDEDREWLWEHLDHCAKAHIDAIGVVVGHPRVAAGPCADIDGSEPGTSPIQDTRQLVASAMADPLLAEVDIEYVRGWEERTAGGAFAPAGVVLHHTGRAGGHWDWNRDFPSLTAILEGVPDVPPPLAQFGVGRSGRVYVIAAGFANHAGSGGWHDLSGNGAVWGIEAENDGEEPWSSEALETYPRLAGALVRATGVSPETICAHHEWRPDQLPCGKPPLIQDGKDDPQGLDMNQFRSRVAKLLEEFPLPEPIEEPPIEIHLDPSNWTAGTSWNAEGPLYNDEPPFPERTSAQGRDTGAFEYIFTMPPFTAGSRSAGIAASIGSDQVPEWLGEQHGSDVTLVVNGVQYETFYVSSYYYGTVYRHWVIPASGLVEGTNVIRFEVRADAENQNGIYIAHQYPWAAGLEDYVIRITLPFRQDIPATGQSVAAIRSQRS